MTFRSILAAFVAGTLSIAPISAQAETRMASPVSQAENVEGNSWIWIALGAAALIILIIVIADDNNNNPASP